MVSPHSGTDSGTRREVRSGQAGASAWSRSDVGEADPSWTPGTTALRLTGRRVACRLLLASASSRCASPLSTSPRRCGFGFSSRPRFGSPSCTTCSRQRWGGRNSHLHSFTIGGERYGMRFDDYPKTRSTEAGDGPACRWRAPALLLRVRLRGLLGPRCRRRTHRHDLAGLEHAVWYTPAWLISSWTCTSKLVARHTPGE